MAELAGIRGRSAAQIVGAIAVAVSAAGVHAQSAETKANIIQWHDYTIHLGDAPAVMFESVEFETSFEVPSFMDVLDTTDTTATQDSIPSYYFVKFGGPVTQDMKKQATEAGAELIDYANNNAFIARISMARKDCVLAVSPVTRVEQYRPEMRISARLLSKVATVAPNALPSTIELTFGELPFAPDLPPEQFTEVFELPSDDVTDGSEYLQLNVTVFRGADLNKVKQDLATMGASVLFDIETEFRTVLGIGIPATDVLGLARVEGVSWVEEYVEPQLYNDAAAQQTRAQPVIQTHGLTGAGQIIGVADTGIDHAGDGDPIHDDISGRVLAIKSWPVSKKTMKVNKKIHAILNHGSDDGAADIDNGHGTHVVGSLLGSGAMSQGQYKGIAPEATLVFQAIEQFTDLPGTSRDGYYLTGIPNSLDTLFRQAYNEGARIHSNSWGASTGGLYSSTSFQVDEFVWKNPDMLLVFAAGNDGRDADKDNLVDPASVGSPGTAKNALTVGASARVIHGEDTESADARVGDWCGLVARRWVFEEAGAACGSRSLARICAIAGIAVECG